MVGAGEVGVAFTGFLGGWGRGAVRGSVGRPGGGRGAGARREGASGGAGPFGGGEGVGEAVQDGGGLLVGEGERRQEPDHRGVAAAEFDDEPPGQTLLLDGEGQGGAAGGTASSGPAASGSTSSTPIIRLRPRTSPTHGWAAARPWSCPSMRAPRVPARSASRFSRTYARVSRAGGHGELVAAEGAGVGAGFPGVQRGAVDDDGEREGAADGLGEDHHVGHDAAVLDGPEGAGAADPGLDLVDDEGMPRSAVTRRIRRIQSSGAG